jgi:hypothetical protein
LPTKEGNFMPLTMETTQPASEVPTFSPTTEAPVTVPLGETVKRTTTAPERPSPPQPLILAR